jgi:hypothetical protein
MSLIRNLVELDLSSNFLAGTIPLKLGHLNLIKELSFYGNLLIGDIPSELGDLTLLTALLFREINSIGIGSPGLVDGIVVLPQLVKWRNSI